MEPVNDMFRFTAVLFNKFTTFLAASYFTRWLCDPHMTFIIVYGINSSQHMSQIMCFWSVLNMQAAKAHTSLRFSADSSKHYLLAYIEKGCRLMLRPKYRSLAFIYSCACILIELFCACAIRTKMRWPRDCFALSPFRHNSY